MIRKSCPGRIREEKLLKIVSGVVAILLWSIAASAAETHHIKIDVPEKIEMTKSFTAAFSAVDEDNSLNENDAASILVTISNWGDRHEFEILLENGTAEKDIVLEKPGNWIVSVLRDTHILYSGRVAVAPIIQSRQISGGK